MSEARSADISVATSTIIPCYRDAHLLQRAVHSVVAQCEPSEIIVVDDGSDPDTALAIRRVAEDSGAVAVRLQERSGPAAARNAGIAASRGRYIAFLDSDDQWLPGKLSAQRTEMDRLNLDFTYTRYANVAGERIRPFAAPHSMTAEDLACDTAIGCSTVMLRRSYVGDRRFPDAPTEDFAFWMRILGKDGRAWRVGDAVMVLRHEGGRSNNRLNAAWRHWRTLRDELQLPRRTAGRYFVNYAIRAAHKHWIKPASAAGSSGTGACSR